MPLAAPRSAVAAWLTKPVAVAWAKNVPTPMSTMPSRTAARLAAEERQANTGQCQRAPQRRAGTPAMNGAAGQERRYDRGQEHEINEAELHRAERQWRAHQDEIDVGEGADEREQDAEADAESRAQPRVAQMRDPRRERRAGGRRHLHHRRGLRDGEVDEHRAGEIERREEIEVRGKAQVVGDRGRNQAADEIAGDIAGDIGGEGATGVGCAAFLAEISQRERKGGRHAKALHDPQHSECGQIRRNREQRGRDREDRQTDQNAKPAVDALAEQGDDQSGNCHAHGARIDGKAHGRRRDAIGRVSVGRIACVANRSTTVRKAVRPITIVRSSTPEG